MPLVSLDGTPDDGPWILSLMEFPTDEQNRHLMFARHKISAAVHKTKDEQKMVVEAKTLRLLLDSPSADELKALRQKATRAGLIAGDILVMVYLMEKVAKTPMPSINKAVHAYLTWGATGATWGDGKALPKSKSVIRDAWASHRTVSHLWAALRLNEYHPFAKRGEVFGDQLGTFLQVAAGMLKFGCEFAPERTFPPSPIPNAAECWCLPASVTAIEPQSPRYPDRLIELLKGYKAPQPIA